ncbi:cysteine-rich CWC family protein [Uliginosibacterium silvisoli]|uniref:cysteine-rich CWC family protein n=1 Tax=Uliginosibacterium silvisoli TaxID=3114758 RepID=UPI003A7F55E1
MNTDGSAPTQPKQNHACPLCGGPNGCAVAQSGSFDVPCWCREQKIDPAVLARIPAAQRNLSCICERCARGVPDKQG